MLAIEMKQMVQLNRPISMSKPYRIDIQNDTQVLIIDSDVMNILLIKVKLPPNPVCRQIVHISTNPSISSMVIKAAVPVLNQPSTMVMGSFVQYLFVDESKKWFRIG